MATWFYPRDEEVPVLFHHQICLVCGSGLIVQRNELQMQTELHCWLSSEHVWVITDRQMVDLADTNVGRLRPRTTPLPVFQHAELPDFHTSPRQQLAIESLLDQAAKSIGRASWQYSIDQQGNIRQPD